MMLSEKVTDFLMDTLGSAAGEFSTLGSSVWEFSTLGSASGRKASLGSVIVMVIGATGWLLVMLNSAAVSVVADCIIGSAGNRSDTLGSAPVTNVDAKCKILVDVSTSGSTVALNISANWVRATRCDVVMSTCNRAFVRSWAAAIAISDGVVVGITTLVGNQERVSVMRVADVVGMYTVNDR